MESRHSYKFVLCCTVLCCALWLWSGTPVSAAEEQTKVATAPSFTEMSIEDLMNLEVTLASKKPEKYFDTPAAIYVITAEEIKRSGVTNIPDAIRLAPGAEVSRIDSNKWAVAMRGGASRMTRSMLVLIDGRPVYSPHFGGVYWEVSDVMLEDIDRIEIVRGPGGSVWGANSLSGVINILTKSPKETQGTLVSIGAGSEEKGFSSVRYGGKTENDLHYRIYAKGFNRDSLYHEKDAMKDYDDWQFGQAGFRTEWDATDRDTITFQGDLYNGRFGNYEALSSYSAPYQQASENENAQYGGNLLGKWHRWLSTSSDLALQMYWDKADQKSEIMSIDTDIFDIDFQHRFQTFFDQDIVWGLGYRLIYNDTIGSDMMFLDPDDRNDELASGFVQDEIDIVKDKLFLTLGTKLEHNDYTGWEFQPSARVLLKPSQNQTLWTSVTRAVRAPSRIDHDYTQTIALSPSLPYFMRYITSDDWNSSKLTAYELGYRVSPVKRVFIDIAGAYNVYSDLVNVDMGSPFVETSPSPAHYVYPLYWSNGLSGRTYNGEISVELEATEWWRLDFTHSVTHATFRMDPGSKDTRTKEQLKLATEALETTIPEHTTTLHSHLDLPKESEFDVMFRSVTRSAAKNISGYNTLDVHVAKEIKEGLELSIVGQNLLDNHHPEDNLTSEVERGVYGKVQWQF